MLSVIYKDTVSLWVILPSVCQNARVATSMYANVPALSVCNTLITAGQLCFYMPPPHVAHGNSGAGSGFSIFVHGHISTLEVCVLQKL